MTSPVGVRARVRAELIHEIKQEARRQVGDGGGSALSLRAVARQVGMVSSGIYRYFPSRDKLLTALIIDSYDALGAVAEAADGACQRGDLAGRWRAVCREVRAWALEHPHEYALLYGTPVLGYRAPEETIGPASRVTKVLAAVVSDAAASGSLGSPFVPQRAPTLSKQAGAEASRVGSIEFPGVPAEAVVRALTAWTQLFGFVSFEVFGRLEGVVLDPEAVFDQAVSDIGAFVGIANIRAST